MKLNNACILSKVINGNSYDNTRNFIDVLTSRSSFLLAKVYVDDHLILTCSPTFSESSGWIICTVDGRLSITPQQYISKVLIHVCDADDNIILESVTNNAHAILPTGDVDTDLNFIVINKRQNNKLKPNVPESKFNQLGTNKIEPCEWDSLEFSEEFYNSLYKKPSSTDTDKIFTVTCVKSEVYATIRAYSFAPAYAFLTRLTRKGDTPSKYWDYTYADKNTNQVSYTMFEGDILEAQIIIHAGGVHNPAQVSLSGPGEVELSGSIMTLYSRNYTNDMIDGVSYWRPRNPTDDGEYYTPYPTEFIKGLNEVFEVENAAPFKGLFKGSKSIVSAKDLLLPATIPWGSCYEEMFYLCDNLVYPPTINLKTTADRCCYNMFSGCTNLLYSPELCKDTPYYMHACAKEAFYGMFCDCKSMIKAHSIGSYNEVKEGGMHYMFSGCESLRRVQPELQLGAVHRYGARYMYSGCIALKEASNIITSASPVIGYGTLGVYPSSVYWCSLEGMYSGCTSLQKATDKLSCMFISSASGGSYSSGCAFRKMFENCVSLKETPTIEVSTVDKYNELPEYNASASFNYMFSNCTSLRKVNDITLYHSTNGETSAGVAGEDYFSKMFNGCTSLNEVGNLTFKFNKASCVECMFCNCTSLTSLDLSNVTPECTVPYMLINSPKLSYIKAKIVSSYAGYETYVDNSFAGVSNTGVFESTTKYYNAGNPNPPFLPLNWTWRKSDT